MFILKVIGIFILGYIATIILIETVFHYIKRFKGDRK